MMVIIKSHPNQSIGQIRNLTMNYKELLDGKKSLNLIVMVCMTKRDHQLFLYGYYSYSSCLSPGHSMGEKAAL